MSSVSCFDMPIIVSRYFFGNRFAGMVIWPFIFVKRKELCQDEIFMNHERIHLRQQLELLIIFFYIWYGLEFLYHWIRLKERHKAYHAISFEQEAYRNEANLSYLKERSLFSFTKYLK